MIEKQIGKRVKRLRTNNGLEFYSNEFNNFYKAKGIRRYLTVRHTLQQNGVTERMNKNLMENVMCMLSNSGLSKIFLTEAASIAYFIINRPSLIAVEKRL
ncbi:unnamed protein product [Fraxinus pennsylvanica]|uniref:Integrase catalytic domain-containing protein n=1 Tax=Fraxinus pennsylvanica TaxID=56036 RepID=A0AAD2AF15_9LAMI|nr:unnamed protein product [Fraxinus pennsylvanica]